MFAIIETGGKQYKVQVGETIYIEKIKQEADSVVTFKQVLAADQQFGNPFLEKALVYGKVLKQGKQKKVIVFKYKPKKSFSKKRGHRQPYTAVEILQIALNGEAFVAAKVAEVATLMTEKVVEEPNKVDDVVKATAPKNEASPKETLVQSEATKDVSATKATVKSEPSSKKAEDSQNAPKND